MDAEATTVHRTHDALQAELIAELLIEAGMAARVVGARAILADEVAELRVEVDAADAATAAELVTAYLASEPSEDFPDEPDDEPDVASGPPPLRRVLAAGVAPVVPGGSHFYARRAWTGGVILVSQIAAVWIMSSGGRSTATAAAVMCCGLLLFDLVGGQLAVIAWNNGQRSGAARQLGVGAAAICVLGAVGVALTPLLLRVQAARHHGGYGGSDDQEVREAPSGPDQLPFPLHMDLSH